MDKTGIGDMPLIAGRPLISVVLTCYNYGKYVAECIESVLAQTYGALEVVIVNDGSSDDSEEVISRFLIDPRVRYISQANAGQAAAKNAGIRAACGDYVAFLDADDLWDRTKLEKQMPLFRDPRVGVVYSRARYIDGQGGLLNPRWARGYLSPRAGKVTKYLFFDNFVIFSSAVVRAECLAKAGVFDASLKMGIDWDLWLRVSVDWEFAFADEPLTSYRIGHSTQMSKNAKERQKCSDRIMREFVERHAALLSGRTIRRAWAYTFCNRADFYRRTEPGLSNRCYLSAIKAEPINPAAYCGLLKNCILRLSGRIRDVYGRTSMRAVLRRRQPKTPAGAVPTGQAAGGPDASSLFGPVPAAARGKIKIAYLIDAMVSDTGGTEKYLIETIKRLDRNLFEPYLIVLSPSRFLEIAKPPCPVFVLAYKGFLKPSFFQVVRELASLMREHRFDVVQTFFEDSIFVGLLAVAAGRVDTVLLSSRRDIGLGETVPWYHRLYRMALPLVNRKFHGIVANSLAVKEHVVLREKTPERKVTVVYNGVGGLAGRAPKPALMEEGPVDFWIGMVANLRPVKRIDVFLRALATLRRTMPALRFKAVIIGDGPEEGNLEGLAKELHLSSYVAFAGRKKDPAAFLRHMHVGVLSSDGEGFSNAILEYMSCGLPVVATAVGGNPELVDESNGFCVPPRDHAALAEALGRLAADAQMRRAMGMASLKKARSYSWERSMASLQKYYMEFFPGLCAGPGTPLTNWGRP